MSGTITVSKLSSLTTAPLTILAPGPASGTLGIYSTDGAVTVQGNGDSTVTVRSTNGPISLIGGLTATLQASGGALVASGNTNASLNATTNDAYVNGATSTTVRATGGAVLVTGTGTATLSSSAAAASLNAFTDAYVNGATSTVRATGGAVLVTGTGTATLSSSTAAASLNASTDAYVNGATSTVRATSGAVLVTGTGTATLSSSTAAASLNAFTDAYVNGATSTVQATGGAVLVTGTGTAIVSSSTAAASLNASTDAYVNGVTSTTVRATGGAVSVTGTDAAYVNGGTTASLNATTMAYVNGANATITTTGTGSTAGISLVSAANATITSSVNGGNVKFTVTNGTAVTASLTLTTTTASSGVIVSNVANPTNAQEAATKAYVDSVAVGLYFKQYCELRASSTNTPFVSSPTYTYNAGAGTITADTAGATYIDTLDSAALTAGGNVVNRVLITQDQVAIGNTFHAGIYAVTTAGAPSVQCVLTRTSDADVYTELNSAYTYVEQGTYAGRSYVQVNTLADFTTSAQSWVLFSETSSAVYHIGPTTLSGTPAVAVSTMASVRRNTDTGYDQNYLAGGMILESQLATQDGTTERKWGPALYLGSPDAAGFGRKGCIRFVATSNGNGSNVYTTDPTSTTILSIQKFCWRLADPADPVISSVCGTTGVITTSANMRSSSSLAQDGDEVMFYGASASNSTWVGGSLDPTTLYFISGLATAGTTFNVTTTLGGTNVTFNNGNIPSGANGIYAWRGIGTFG